MNKKVFKWILRIALVLSILFGGLVFIYLNPSMFYDHNTTIEHYTIYHNSSLDHDFYTHLDSARIFIQRSELFDTAVDLDICLNDGSFYPLLMEKIRGQAFGWGFYNKVILEGNSINYARNYVELNGYRWNLTQLITHESMHCYQFATYGFLGSNPLAAHDTWKWEGYPEYIARRNPDQQNLSHNIAYYLQAKKNNPTDWSITLSDNTITPKEYYKSWLLVQYCFDVKGMNYDTLLEDDQDKEDVEKEMMKWHKDQVEKTKH